MSPRSVLLDSPASPSRGIGQKMLSRCRHLLIFFNTSPLAGHRSENVIPMSTLLQFSHYSATITCLMYIGWKLLTPCPEIDKKWGIGFQKFYLCPYLIINQEKVQFLYMVANFFALCPAIPIAFQYSSTSPQSKKRSNTPVLPILQHPFA